MFKRNSAVTQLQHFKNFTVENVYVLNYITLNFNPYVLFFKLNYLNKWQQLNGKWEDKIQIIHCETIVS